jgi:hypothetical protein
MRQVVALTAGDRRMKILKRRRLLAVFAVALASLAIAAPAAQADDWYRGSTPSRTEATTLSAHDYQVLKQMYESTHVEGTATTTATRPDDRSGIRGPGEADARQPVSTIEPVGFDWTDAGIGAAMAFGLLLLASGAVLVARRHRRPRAIAL